MTFRVAGMRLFMSPSLTFRRSSCSKRFLSSTTTPSHRNPIASSSFGTIAGAASLVCVATIASSHENTRLRDNIYIMNHCQVPCGIFDDPAMINELKQNCLTIRKAIVQANSLHGHYVDTTPLNANQFIRWVMTKEEHANKIIATISDYCLCQRVKRANFATEEEYLQALKFHHVVMQAAMKAKQSMDIVACEVLELAVEDLARMYIPEVALVV
ncbi:nickel-containing superoxide dismutase [Nitzschia inconspicua]|uniref:Nickel-containing superoxide dismutase n=1 Tax=Nitzschia inconspicua TaxID=303405 RepID=A0A9K3KKP8_9STRA|nr:nickel-containing superoxide dismutase [Nitzschia inconspicua]